MRKHRQSEITVRNGSLEVTFCFCTFRVYMYPLMVQRSICKHIDALLRKFYIIRNANLLAYQLFKFLVGVNNYFFHYSLFIFNSFYG